MAGMITHTWGEKGWFFGVPPYFRFSTFIKFWPSNYYLHSIMASDSEKILHHFNVVWLLFSRCTFSFVPFHILVLFVFGNSCIGIRFLFFCFATQLHWMNEMASSNLFGYFSLQEYSNLGKITRKDYTDFSWEKKTMIISLHLLERMTTGL